MNRVVARSLAAVCVLLVLGGGAVVYLRWRSAAAPEAALVAQGRLREAQLTLRDRLAKAPDDAELHARMGALQLMMGDPVGAERELRRGLAMGATRETLVSELGQSLLQQQRYDEVLRLVPSTGATPAAAARNLALRARAQLAERNLVGARATLAASRTAAPDEADTALIAAMIAAATPGTAPAEAESLADEVLARDPDQFDALLMKVRLLSARGDQAGAQAMADRALLVRPWSTEARITQAYQAMGRNDDAQAQQDVDRVLRDQPSSIDAVYLKGVLLLRRGEYEQAGALLTRLDAASTRFPQILFYQARIAQAQKQLETAADLARRYNTIVPTDPDGVRLRAETALGIGLAADALGTVRAYGLAHPDDLGIQVTYARLLAVTRDMPGASRVLLQVADRQDVPPALVPDLGLTLLQTGNARRALPLLEDATSRQPAAATLWEALAFAAIDLRQTETADRAIDRLRALPDTAESVGNLMGLVKLQAGDPAGAGTIWASTVARFPAATAARFNLARLKLRNGAPAEAQEELGQLLSQEPANIPALQLFIELSAGRPAILLPRLQAAHDARPNDPLLSALLADFLTANGKPQGAIDLVGQLRGPVPAMLLPVLGRAQAAAGQTEAAIATLRSALDAFPRDEAVRSALVGLVRSRDGDAAAVALLQDSIRKAPGDLAAMSSLVALVQRTQGLDAALAVAAQLRADPANGPAAGLLQGGALMVARRFADAASAYAAAFAAAPSLPVLLNLSAARGLSGDTAGATAGLQAWVAAHPDAAGAWTMLAKLDLTAKRYPEALAALGNVLRLQPDDAEALNNVAWIYLLTDDRRAKAAAQAAYLKAPSPDSADTLGWILVSEGNAAGALPLLRRADQQRPNDPTIRYHLASALGATGQRAEALALLDQIAAPAVGPFAERAEAVALAASLRAGR